MNCESQELDQEFEKTRRCLLNIAHSKNQTHAGYLIAVAIGSFTLISRWDIFFSLSPKPIISITALLFFVIISATAAVTFYFIKRTCYWASYGSSVLDMSISHANELFEKYKSKPKHKYLRERMNTCSCIFNAAVAQSLEDLYLSKEKGQVGRTTRFAVMYDGITLWLSLEIGLIVFETLLIGFLFL